MSRSEARDHNSETVAFGKPLAELRRLKLISEGRLPNSGETFMIEIAMSCDMSQYLEYT
jgi:hypothetical protein